MNVDSHNELSEKGLFPWYCVRTQPKREAIAAAQVVLLDGVDVFAPRIRFRRNTKRGKVWFEEALFPGYIFARFDMLNNCRAVSSAVGVRGLVRFSGECAQISNAIVEALRAEQVDECLPRVVDEPVMVQGDEAQVVAGAFIGLHAVITNVLSGGERVKILMKLMGTAVEAEIPIGALEKVA